MAVDMFIKIGDIKGESEDDKHKDEITVLEWNWSMSQAGKTSTWLGGGGGTGKVEVKDLSLTKYVDKASPNLMKFCCSGKPCDQALLTVRKSVGTKLEYIKITMKEVLISYVSTGGSGGEDRLTEHVKLNFAEFKVEYTPENKDGTAAATIPMGYSVKENKETA